MQINNNNNNKTHGAAVFSVELSLNSLKSVSFLVALTGF